MKYFKNSYYPTLYKLRKEFDELCKTYHPTHGGNDEEFQELYTEYYDLREEVEKHLRKNRKKAEYHHHERQLATEQPPADGITLEPIAGGLAIIGTKDVLIKNHVALREHGGRWFPELKQWRCYDRFDIRTLCEWFGIDYEYMQRQIDAKTTPNLGALIQMIENGEDVTGIRAVHIGPFINYTEFITHFNNIYRPALERMQQGFIHERDAYVIRNIAEDMLIAFDTDTNTPNQK